jgi:hypothetical protein
MTDRFKDAEDLFWLSDDFVMDPDKMGAHDIVMVMLPQKALTIGEREGVKDAVILYPAVTTDMILRRHFGIPPGEPDIASAILAFDVI